LKKALITGGAGFVGGHLAQRLVSEGCHLDLVDNFSRGAEDAILAALEETGRVRVLNRDLRERDALADADADYDAIFHLASIVGVASVLERPYEVLRDNAAMTDQALALARSQSRPARFVFASTSEVYSGTLEHFELPIPTPESTPLAVADLSHPRTSYMLSKIYGEAMCHQAGVPFSIIRPHNLYGPRMGLSHVIPELLQRAYFAPDGGSLEVYSVDHKRTFCYIDDAVEIVIRAAESPQCAGRTLNVGRDEEELSIGELAALVVKIVGKELRIEPRPPTPGSPPRRSPDIGTTTELTGYRPETTLEDGLRKTYDAYVQNAFKPAAEVGSR
jgi:UDP-glucose 4-epimerase